MLFTACNKGEKSSSPKFMAISIITIIFFREKKSVDIYVFME